MRIIHQRKKRTGRLAALLLALTCDPIAAGAQTATPAVKEADAKPDAPEIWSVHGQFTNVVQMHPAFGALYAGPNSVDNRAEIRETNSATAYLGVRLWPGAELYFNPEVDQGFGIANTLGIAGFPSGEAYKVGKALPYVRAQRYFLRQVFGLGGGTEQTESGQNQLAGPVDVNRITFTIGKFAVADIFDDNKYAHDNRNGFQNWSIFEMGAFDYAADAWGFTNGAAVELKQDWWTARVGVFQLSKVPNSTQIEPQLFRQWSSVAEFEERHEIAGQPGKVKFLAYGNYGFMGTYDRAVQMAALTGDTPDISADRRRRSKFGGGINVEQQVTPDIGIFARASYASSRYETFEFTEIERSLSGGVVFSGNLWGRPKDAIGVGGALNGIGSSHAAYLAAGGTGILLGDGALRYGGEKVVETYYKLAMTDLLSMTFDYQFVSNPGYNQDRGPIHIFGIRTHVEF